MEALLGAYEAMSDETIGHQMIDHRPKLHGVLLYNTWLIKGIVQGCKRSSRRGSNRFGAEVQPISRDRLTTDWLPEPAVVVTG